MAEDKKVKPKTESKTLPKVDKTKIEKFQQGGKIKKKDQNFAGVENYT